VTEALPGDAPESRALSRLAHGLRTPLALIVGYAELLGSRRDEATLAEAPARIAEAAEELARAVDDLLTVYAIDAQALVLARAPLPLAAAIDDVAAALAAKGKHVRAVEAEDAADVQVLADDEYFRHILRTLLENARNRTPEESAIFIHTQREGAFARIEIEDDGGELRDVERATAFERFSPLEPKSGRTTGLELYKVRRLVELHGGRVWAETGTPGTSRFGFTLPLADDSR
jgi:signal transduction histidine kinase